jgi:hypothetical protein
MATLRFSLCIELLPFPPPPPPPPPRRQYDKYMVMPFLKHLYPLPSFPEPRKPQAFLLHSTSARFDMYPPS